MLEKLQRFGLAKIGFIVFATLLGASIYLAFGHYQLLHPSESLSSQIIGFLESGAFTVITVSLGLPTLLFLSENLFSISKVVDERIQIEKERRRDKRWECVALTSQMWTDLYNLASEVRYYKKKANEKANIEERIKKLQNYINRVEEVINKVSFRFPDLPVECRVDIITFVNVLLLSAISVAYRINETDDIKEISRLQDCLEIIQEGIRSMIHHPMINILKSSAELQEIDLPGDKKRIFQERINASLKTLEDNATNLKKEELKLEILPTLKGTNADNFREMAKITANKLAKLMQEKKEKEIESSEEFNSFKESFHNIDLDDRINAIKHPYTPKCLEKLAEFFAFQIACDHVEYMALLQKRLSSESASHP